MLVTRTQMGTHPRELMLGWRKEDRSLGKEAGGAQGTCAQPGPGLPGGGDPEMQARGWARLSQATSG